MNRLFLLFITIPFVFACSETHIYDSEVGVLDYIIDQSIPTDEDGVIPVLIPDEDGNLVPIRDGLGNIVYHATADIIFPQNSLTTSILIKYDKHLKYKGSFSDSGVGVETYNRPHYINGDPRIRYYILEIVVDSRVEYENIHNIFLNPDGMETAENYIYYIRYGDF